MSKGVIKIVINKKQSLNLIINKNQEKKIISNYNLSFITRKINTNKK